MICYIKSGITFSHGFNRNMNIENVGNDMRGKTYFTYDIIDSSLNIQASNGILQNIFCWLYGPVLSQYMIKCIQSFSAIISQTV